MQRVIAIDASGVGVQSGQDVVIQNLEASGKTFSYLIAIIDKLQVWLSLLMPCGHQQCSNVYACIQPNELKMLGVLILKFAMYAFCPMHWPADGQAEISGGCIFTCRASKRSKLA